MVRIDKISIRTSLGRKPRKILRKILGHSSLSGDHGLVMGVTRVESSRRSCQEHLAFEIQRCRRDDSTLTNETYLRSGRNTTIAVDARAVALTVNHKIIRRDFTICSLVDQFHSSRFRHALPARPSGDGRCRDPDPFSERAQSEARST